MGDGELLRIALGVVAIAVMTMAPRLDDDVCPGCPCAQCDELRKQMYLLVERLEDRVQARTGSLPRRAALRILRAVPESGRPGPESSS